MKKVLYVDMDGVLADFNLALEQTPAEIRREYEGHPDDIPGIFGRMDPLPGAVEAYQELSRLFDTYILSTAPWDNPSGWSDKLLWVKRYLGGDPDDAAYKRLILSHHKNLNRGHFLIDDRTKSGVDRFAGEHIHFGSEKFPGWPSVLDYLRAVVRNPRKPINRNALMPIRHSTGAGKLRRRVTGSCAACRHGLG